MEDGLLDVLPKARHEAGLSQAEVAARTGLTQPKVSDVVNGRLKGYSVERLLTIINRLGRDVEVRISRRNVRQRPATVRVTAA